MTEFSNFEENSSQKSKICRICAEESAYGESLFYGNDEIRKLASKICSYISIKLKHVRRYPNWICPGCLLQFETSNQFFQLIRNGQKMLIEKFGAEPRKGRKRKNKHITYEAVPECVEGEKELALYERKRSTKTPGRLKDSMQGNELEELYSEMGIARKPLKEPRKKPKPNIIADIKNEEGMTLGEMLCIPGNPQRTSTRYQCGVCKEHFVSNAAFYKHVVIHTNILYECTECEQSFQSKKIFDEHQVTENHKGLGIIEMPYSEAEKLNNDKSVPDSPEPKEEVVTSPKSPPKTRFVCIKCSKSFRYKYALQRHLVSHTQLRPYTCDICSASFKKKTILTMHRSIHIGEHQFKCHKCTKTFLHKHTLKAHLRYHDGLKPYICTICKKSFSQLGTLHEHRRIHTGERPYVCLICGTSFKTSSQCRAHQKSHIPADERPPKASEVETIRKAHNCMACGKLFSQRSAMMKHYRTHTGEKPYMCHLCPRRFADPSNFKKHKLFHAMQSEQQKAKAKSSNSLLKERPTRESPHSEPDPDPDAFLSMNSSLPCDNLIPPTRSLMDMLDEDDRGSKTWGLLRESSDPIITEIHNDDSSFLQPPQSMNQLVCISYQDPMNPVSSKTTFYVVN